MASNSQPTGQVRQAKSSQANVGRSVEPVEKTYLRIFNLRGAF